MAEIIKEVRIDVSQPNVFQAIIAKQLDCNSRFLKVTLTDSGVKISVPNTAEVTINANRPDGQSKSFIGVANDDGTFTVPLTQWMLEIAGMLKCDVSVINTTDKKRLTSTDFEVVVQEAANRDTDVSVNPDGEFRVIIPTQIIDENSSDDEYPSAKAVYNLDNIAANASGSLITIKSSEAPFLNFEVRGKTTQNGTPTPDAPVPLVSAGDSGSFGVGVYGKNLLEIPREVGYTETVKGIVYTVNDDKSISVSGTPTDTTSWKNITFSNQKFSLPKGTYKFACKGLKNSTKLHPILYYTNSNNTAQSIVSYSGRGVESIPFTITDENKDNIYLVIGCYPDYTPQGERLYISIFPESVTDLSYEQYNKQTLTIPYNLRSTKNTKDELDFENAMAIEKTIKIVFTGDEEMYGQGDYAIFKGTYGLKAGTGISGALSNRLTELPAEQHYQNKEVGFSISNEEDRIRITIGNTTTLDEVKAKLAEWYAEGNPLIIIAEREVPLKHFFALEKDHTYPLQEAHKKLKTNKGNTTIMSEAETKVEYFVDTPNAQVIANIHSKVNECYLTLQQAIT